MATRATEDLSKALIKTAAVKAASSVTAGFPIKRDGDTVLNCSAGNGADGIALATAAAGEMVSFAVANGGGLAKVKVGTGGATAGQFGVAVADGVTDSGVLGGGTTLVNIVCKFVQTGVAGDLVGAIPLSFATVKA